MEEHTLFGAEIKLQHCHPKIDAYYFKQWNGCRMSYHTHDHTEIMYMISGSCLIELKAHPHNSEPVRLKKGEFIVLNANIPHRLLVEEDSPCRMLNLEFHFTPGSGPSPTIFHLAEEEQSLHTLLHCSKPYVVLRDFDEVYHPLKSIVLELDRRRSSDGSVIHMMLMQLLLRIAKLHTETEDISPQADFYVRKSLQFLHQNYDRDIRIKEIASTVNIHPGYLHRIFKTYMRKTPTAYLTELRMEKAKMLLRQTDMSVSDVCDYVGISSRPYFHTLFKRYTGLTPLEFRNTIADYTKLSPK